MKTIKIKKNNWLFNKVLEHTEYNTVHESNMNLCTYMKFVLIYFMLVAKKCFYIVFGAIVVILLCTSAGLGTTAETSMAVNAFEYLFDIHLVYEPGIILYAASFITGFTGIMIFLLGVTLLIAPFFMILNYYQSYKSKRRNSDKSDNIFFSYVNDKFNKVCSKIEIID